MSGFDQSQHNAFFNFNNLTPQQLNMLRQQSQMQQAVQMPQQQQQQQPQPQPPPGAQPQMQQRNPIMPQLGLPGGFNQQQLQAFMAQQQSQLANGMMGNNQNPLAQMMRPQNVVPPQAAQPQMQQPQLQMQPQQQQQPQAQQQQQPQQQQHAQLQGQMGLQQPSTSQPAHLQQQPQQTPNMGATPQVGGLAGPTPTFAQLSHAIEQAKKGNLTQEQMIQLRQLITRQQNMQTQQQQAAQNQSSSARPLQPGQSMLNMNAATGQNFANSMQRTPQMQAQAQMMVGLQQIRPNGPQSTPPMGSQGFLQPPAPGQQQQPNQVQSSPQISLQNPAQMNQQQQQMARAPAAQQVPGLQQNTQQAPQMVGQQRPVARPEQGSDTRNQQQNPLNFLRLLHQRVTDIESKLNSDLSAEERQIVQQQHAEAKRLQSALLQRLNVQNAQQFAALMQQGQQNQNAQAGQMQSNQTQQQPQQQQGVGLMGNAMMGNNNTVQPHASPVIRPPNRPGSARPPQGQFGSPMLNQTGLQNQNAQQAAPQQSPQVRPSPQMGAINIAGQPGTSGLQGVPSLRPEQFMKALVDLMKKRGTPITSLPKVGGRELDLYRFYQIVQAHGGSEGAHQKGAWPAIAMSLELAPLGSPQTQALGQALATEYRNYLAPFEETWQRAMQHQYQMSMATAGLGQTQAQGSNPQAPAFRPPSTPQMQSQQPNQQPAHMQNQQPSMMPPNQPQQQPPMQAQNTQQAVRPPQPNLADFNPPPPPILTPDHLAKLGMTQEQFNKVFLTNQLNIWRQEQLQNQQRQMNQGFQANQAGQSNAQAPGQNGMQQSAQQQLQQPQQPQQQPGAGPQAQQQQQMGWQNQQRPMMPQTSGAQPSQIQPNSFGAGLPGHLSQQMQNSMQQGQNVQGMQQGQQQPQMQAQPSQAQQPGGQNMPGQANATGPQQGQQGQVAGRPNNMSQAKFIAVSPEQLEQARAAMQKIDQELVTQRPRLPIIQNIADDERDQILDQVQKLAPIQASVTALLPAFYAMNGSLEPAKRLKIMAFMYKDQYDLLPKKQCILRLADLDKLKMQMSRCISFVRSSNPELAQRIMSSLGEQTRAAQQNGAAVPVVGTNAITAPGSSQQGASAAVAPAPAPGAAAPADATANQTQGAESAPGVNADGSFDAAAAMHGIKRGLRPENLKLPANKRAKNAPGAGKAMSPSANESPKVAPSPAQPEDTPTPAGSTPAAKGGKKNDKAAKGVKATAKKGKGAAGTPTSSAAEPDKKFKTSADIMAEVKREMAEAERKRREEGSGGAGAADASAATAAKVDTANVKAEQEADEKRKKDTDLAGRDPAGLVESTWQELLATGNANNGLRPNGSGDNSLLGAPSAGPSAQNGSDPKSLQSLMSLLGQDSMLSGLPSNGVNLPSKGLMGDSSGAGGSSFLNGALDSLPSADADAGLDIDLFDFIEASAAGPDAFNDTDIDLGGVFGSGSLNASTQESEPPVETPELVASARLPGGSSNASTASNSTANSMRAKLPAALGGSGLDFGSAGPSSTSPAEMSSCDEIDLDKSPFVHRMRLDRIGLTMAPTASGHEASKMSSKEAGQSTGKAPEETAISQVELGPGSQGNVAGSGDEWWDLDHFASTMGGGFGTDANADQPWAVLS